MAHSESSERPYALPRASDSTESSRLDEQHDALKLLLNGLYPSPKLVEEVLKASDGRIKSIIDLGSGSGAWCMDMAHQFPYAQVVGIDIVPNPVQSDTSNCRFEVRDINKGLSTLYGQFDFVHIRFLHGLTDHHAMVMEAIKCLKPGGLIMIIGSGASVTEDRVTLYPAASSNTPDGSWFQRFWYLIEPAVRAKGQVTHLHAPDFQNGLWDFDGIDTDTCGAAFITIPIGPWATTSDPEETARLKKVGEVWKVNTLRIHKLLAYVVAESGRSSKDLELLYKRVAEELESTRIRSSFFSRAIWGRALTVGGSSSTKKEISQHRSTSSSVLSDKGEYQVVTYFDSKPAWTNFNTDLRSTITPDTKGLRDIPGFDPIEE